MADQDAGLGPVIVGDGICAVLRYNVEVEVDEAFSGDGSGRGPGAVRGVAGGAGKTIVHHVIGVVGEAGVFDHLVGEVVGFFDF